MQITVVQAGSAADLGGLMPNDVIVKFQSQQIQDFQTLTTLIGACDPGDKVVIELQRGGRLLKKTIELGAWK